MPTRNRTTSPDRLRCKGIKATPQRIAILEYLESGRIHPSAEEIFGALKGTVAGLSLATVYNTVERLAGCGEAHKIDIASDRARYEAARPTHHHFYCTTCGSIFDIDIVCPHMKTLQAGPHKITEIHGYFKGTCKDCLANNKKKDRRLNHEDTKTPGKH